MIDLRTKRDSVLDRAMNVRTSEDELRSWNRKAIVKSLKRELEPADGLWKEIAERVERQIKRMRLETITAPLIRELVCVELLRRGKERI
jgi:hypothetical protein